MSAEKFSLLARGFPGALGCGEQKDQDRDQG